MNKKLEEKLKEKFSVFEGSDSYNDYDEDLVVSEFETMKELFAFIDEHFVLRGKHTTKCSVACERKDCDLYTKDQVLELIGEDREESTGNPYALENDLGYNQAKQEIRDRF